MTGLHDGATVGDVVTAALRRFPDRVAFAQDGSELTYREVEDALARRVSVLGQRGLRPGEGVGLLSPSRPEAWFAQVAPPLAGGRYTALHPQGSLGDHLHICDEAELRILFVDPAFAERAAQLLQGAAGLEAVFTFGPSDVGEDINELAAKVISNGRLARGPHGADRIAYVLYTGGTSGVPKAATISDRAVVAHYYGTTFGLDLPSEPRYLAVAPISHAAGMLIVPTLMRGGAVILHPLDLPRGGLPRRPHRRHTRPLRAAGGRIPQRGQAEAI